MESTYQTQKLVISEIRKSNVHVHVEPWALFQQ